MPFARIRTLSSSRLVRPPSPFCHLFFLRWVMLHSLPDDVIILIIHLVPSEISRTCKKYRLLAALRGGGSECAFIFRSILLGRSSTLSFEKSYRTFYTMALQKRQTDVSFLFKRSCLLHRHCVQWYDRDRVSDMITDVCMFLTRRGYFETRNNIRRMLQKPRVRTARRVLFSKRFLRHNS